MDSELKARAAALTSDDPEFRFGFYTVAMDGDRELLELLASRNPSQFAFNLAIQGIIIANQDPGLIDLLVQHGADVNYNPRGKQTLLQLAYREGNSPAIDRLLTLGARQEENSSTANKLLSLEVQPEENSSTVVNKLLSLEVQPEENSSTVVNKLLSLEVQPEKNSSTVVNKLLSLEVQPEENSSTVVNKLLSLEIESEKDSSASNKLLFLDSDYSEFEEEDVLDLIAQIGKRGRPIRWSQCRVGNQSLKSKAEEYELTRVVAKLEELEELETSNP